MKEFIYILLFLLSIIGIGFLMSWIGKRNARRCREYEKAYEVINDAIDVLRVDEFNFNQIEDERQRLLLLPYKNKEKTDVLTRKFGEKFYKQWLNAILKEQE